MKNKVVTYFIIGTFVTLYLIVSVISTIHVIDFFRLSNPEWLAISLAVAFEIGAAASLASLIALKKMNKTLVWILFITLTAMQMMGNTYFAFTNLENYKDWVDLFGLTDEEPLFQKRVLSIISGAVLPLVALGFIKSLVDYIKPEDSEGDDIPVVNKPTPPDNTPPDNTPPVKEKKTVWDNAISKTYESPVDEDELRNVLSSELSPKDIDNYIEKSRISKTDDDNPHLLPGVRT
jgi:hypothetical protein